MKIEKLEFSNINSLAGEYVVDFLHPELSTPGMFVITGPTGSGKTTLLDAICFALYGDTPRQQGRFSRPSRERSENMTYGAMSCYARVYFEHGGQHYMCKTVHVRTGPGASSPFNPPRYSMYSVGADGALTQMAKGGDVASTVERITCLSFSNFKRCMMLPQGEFANFLKSAGADRSQALTQLTGMEIYKKIGERVSEHISGLEARLREYPQIEPMDAAALALLEKEIEAATESYEQANAQVSHCNQALQWLQTKTDLEKQFRDAQTYKHDALQQLMQFQEDGRAAQLSLAERALPVEAPYGRLSHARETRDGFLRQLPGLEKKSQDASASLEQVLHEVTAQRAQFDKDSALLEQRRSDIEDEMRPQENQLARLRQELQGARDTLNKREQAVQGATNDKNEAQDLLTRLNRDVEQLREQLQATAANAGLGGLLERLQLRLHAWAAADSNGAELPEHVLLLQQHRDVIGKIEAILQGETYENWLSHSKDLEALLQVQKELSHHRNKQAEAQRFIDQMQRAMDELPALEQLEAQLNERREARQLMDKVRGLEAKLSELYADFRKGKYKQCPCCGSTTPGERHMVEDAAYAEAVEEERRADVALKDTIRQRGEYERELTRLRASFDFHETEFAKSANHLQNLLAQMQLSEVPQQLEDEVARRTLQRDSLRELRPQAAACEQQLIISQCRCDFIQELSGRPEPAPVTLTAAHSLVQNLQHQHNLYEQRRSQLNQLEQDLLQATGRFDTTSALEQHELKELQRVQDQVNQLQMSEIDATQKFNERWGDGMSVQLAVAQSLAEERRIQNGRQKAADALAEAQQEATSYAQQWKQGQQHAHDATRETERLSAEFTQALQEQAFADETAFLQARQYVPLVQELRLCSNRLNSNLESTSAACDAWQSQLANHLKHSPLQAGETTESLTALREEYLLKLKPLLEHLTELNVRLSQDKAIRQQKEEQDAAIAQIKTQKEWWDKLYSVLGGKKEGFMRYAQQMTLDALVYQANQQLRHYTDRYLLRRDENRGEGLELSIVDFALGDDVVRSCSNLSGGESFLVSLSLALGLSHLTSGAQIDTLFLDEGFGTLDAETLEQVVSSLEIMKSSGKMVGIITHVEKLSERIPAEIRVAPVEDGYSRLLPHPAVTTKYQHPSR